ncbi:hypothetical protein ACSTJF_00055, partial [Vibrio parahaemolyticus]
PSLDQHLDHAIRTAGEVAESTVGRLGIGLHSSIAAGFLADLPGQYRERYLDIEQVVAPRRRPKSGKAGATSPS